MGAQGVAHPRWLLTLHLTPRCSTMAPMKAMKAATAMKKSSSVMTKSGLIGAIATERSMKHKECSQVLNSLAAIAAKEVKKTGVFTLPGLCRIKTRVKPATKAGVRVMFGEEKKVKAKPARTIVKAYPVAALKQQI